MDELLESDLRDARQALAEIARQRTELRRACEDAVVEWQWARPFSDLQRPQPLYRQRCGLPAPRLLAQAPPDPQDEHQYGFDATGDIVVAREFVYRGSFREEFRVRRGDTVVGYRWSESGEPFEVNVARFAEEGIRSYVTVSAALREDDLHGWSSERYVYDAGRITEIHEDCDLAFRNEPFQSGPSHITATYDPAGRLQELREHGDRGEKVLYRARGSGPSMQTLQRRVEDRLVETVPTLAREHARGEPLYCLVLHYHPEWPLPPTVGLGLEHDRQGWIDDIDDPETLRLTVWNPAEFSSYRDGTVGADLTKIDAELAEAINAIPQDADGAGERGRRTLNRAARRLHGLDWPSIAHVTDDFVVFAVDLELTHLERNFRHSVPGALREALARRGLI